jgi:hypothetical protein
MIGEIFRPEGRKCSNMKETKNVYNTVFPLENLKELSICHV